MYFYLFVVHVTHGWTRRRSSARAKGAAKASTPSGTKQATSSSAHSYSTPPSTHAGMFRITTNFLWGCRVAIEYFCFNCFMDQKHFADVSLLKTFFYTWLITSKLWKSAMKNSQHFHLLATTTKILVIMRLITNFSVALVASWLQFWFQLL